MSFSEWQKKKKQQEQGVAPSAPTTEPQANAATQRPSFAEWHSKKKETSSAQGWLDSVNSFLGDVNNRYKGWNNSSDDYNSIFNRSQELLLAADGWRKQYAGDPNAVNAINQAVDSLGRAQEYSKAYYDFYSQFGSADEYDTWTRKQDFIRRYVEDPDMALVKGGYEPGWVEEAEYSKKYSSHATNPDGKMGWEKYLSDQQKPEEEETWLDAIGRYLGNGGIVDTTLPNAGVTQTIHDLRADDSWKHPQADWNQEQKNIYGSLYLDSPYEAEQFAIYTNRRNKEIAEADKMRKIRESATDNFGMGLLHSLGSIATSTMGMADLLANLAEANARGTITDDGQVSPFEYSQAVQGGISEHLNQKSGTIDEKVPIFGGKGAGDLYSLGMSVLESTASMALGPGGTLVTFFGSAGASAMEDALNRGAEDWQAALYGLAAGVFEGLAEQIGIDNLFRLGGSTTVRETIKNILKQAGAEGAEEGLTALFTNIADNAILQEKSHYYELVSQYQQEGMDYNRAKAKAWLESVEGVAYDTITGAVSGAVHAAPVMTGQYVSNRNNTADRIYGDNAADLVTEALEIDPSNAYAQKLKGKLDSGKALSGAELNRLVKQNEKRIKDAETDTTAEDTEETPPPPSEASATQTETAPPTESAPLHENAAEGEYEASEGITLKTVADTTATRQTALNEASKKYGAQAGAMVAIYKDGQDVDSFDRAFKVAFDMGRAGVSLSYAMNSDSTAYLTEKQRELAHGIGVDSSNSEASERSEDNKKKANGKTGRRIGTVKGEGVTIKDLRKTFNDTQGVAYKVLTTCAEATGIDIVLFKSEANEDGRFDGAQGRFAWKEDTIYIDINAGLVNIESVKDLAKYTMLRTFAHEFTHFIEKWNPIQYNEFRRVVFDAMTARGENVHDLIELKQAQTSGMSYDKASREVMAEAMTDILPDSSFVQTLAENHKSIFNKLLEKLKEFVADLKAYFRTIGSTSTREARALKEQVGESLKYVENIVSMFDRIAVEAVESYQLTVATDEAVVEAAPVPSPVEETAPANVHDTPKNADNPAEKPNIAADATTDGDNGDAFSITDNAEYGTLEIKFDGKPSETVRNALKAHKFRWHGKKGVWYGKGERSDIVRVLREAYKVEEATPSVATSDESNNKTSMIERAYQIGKKEAETQRAIVPAAKSKDMNDLMKEAGSNLLPIIESFDKGVADEINRQTVSELDPSKDSDATSTSRSPSNALESIRNRYPGRFIIYQNEDGSYSVPELNVSYPSNWDVSKAIDAVAKSRDVVLVQGDKITEYPARKVSDSADSDTSMTQNGVIIEKEPSDFEKSFWNATEAERDEVIDAMNKQNKMTRMKPTELPPVTREAVEEVKEPKSATEILREMGGKANGEYMTDVTDLFFPGLSKNKQATEKSTEEVTANVENADNQGSVLQPDRNREGDSRLLDEVEARDVQGDVRAGDSVGDPVQRGQETGRSGLRSDSSTGDVGGHGDGGRESADLRRDGGLTDSVPSVEEHPSADPVDEAAAEALHEVVTEEIAKKSTENPKGRNFVIGDSLNLPSGDKARYKANVEAIRLVKKLEAEGRYATEDEQVILSKYVGWGGLANAFDSRKADWAKEYAELAEILTKEEYESARGSTLNAHYTEISVIKAMYDGLAGLGFDGGMMLEPSAGVGNFVGAMPSAMSAKVRGWTMVELDGITGLIAKYLYPNANVQIQGFESTVIPDNFMDVAISNVPFGNYPVTDKAYPKKITSAIHNYFFAKALDKVRPGGIVMFITSAYTMNARETTVRNYIMQKADLLGAIRLPDSAFKSNAGTEVVTDILILKKRPPHTPYAGVDFLEAPFTTLSNESYNGAYINTYFTEHPEMVLGTPSLTGSMYRGDSLTYKAFTDRGSLADQIREAFTHIEGKMDYPQSLSKERTNFAVERASKKTKKNGYEVKDGKIYRNQDGELVEQQIPEKTAERIKGLLGIRDAHRNLMNSQQQGVNEAEIKKARAVLNKLYDDFVKRYGFINAPANRNAFRDDPDRNTLFSLEIYDPDTKTAKKADVFRVNTITPNRTITSAANVSEGLIISRNETGSVDVGMIAKLTGKSEVDVTRELLESRLVYKTKDGNLEAAETYLSGNVRAKLRDAEAMLPFDVDYAMNIEDLKAVVPKDVACEDIFVNPGTPWIPNSVYSDFAAYILGGRNYEFNPAVIVTRNRDTGNFTVDVRGKYLKNTVANLQKWGTSRRTFLDIFDALLNSRSIVVKNKLDDGSFVVDADATAAANEKMEAIGKEFQDWLWRDEARRDELTRLYNETFNALVTPKYNGDNLTVNGANAAKPLRPHQRDAVQRVIASGGNTLLAHKVGAGKTYEMAAAAMKLKQLGLVKKPMFAVPKSLVAQWGNEFMDFFPTAKLLVADENDFTPANRRVFINRIANGDYDAVILSYEQFEKIPVSDDFAKDLYQEQIDSVIAAIEEARAEQGDKALSIKDLEKKRKTLQAKIDKLTSKPKDDDNILFEQLGVDSLFVDEAHNFKNLFYTTSMTNVAGLGNKDGAERAFDLYTKVRYLQRLNGGRGIVFATATPVMNSMSEMYIMQKYLQPDLLEQLGLTSFDAWAKQFGEVVNGVEIKPSGQGYRVKQSFSRFKNLSELQLLFRNFADVLTEIPGLKIPKMKGGKVNVVVCEPSEFQQDYMKLLEERAEHIKNVDPSVDNMLKITSDGRKISYTQRMIDPSLPYEEGCKIYRCADNVVATYKESAKIKGSQLIFCDMATPKGKSKAKSSATDESEMDMESAHLYEDIRARLIEKGIPAKEIAFIHEADTDSKKKKLFADVNEGKVRVLIGSTAKMGVGMNAQKRVVAIHHLDAPWRPGDVEQRNGRAFRQGNINDEVECFTYVTEGSFDARLWDILERKQNFIDQIMNGEDVGREAEDTGEVTLSAAEVKALASGSPWIMEQVQIESDIKKLESLYRAHTASIREARIRLSRSISDVAMYEKSLAAVREDLKARKDTYSEENFSITIGNKNYTVKKDAGVAFIKEAVSKAKESDYVTIATFAGFELKVIKTPEGVKGMMFGEQSYPFNVYPGNSSYQINVLVNLISGLDARVNMLASDLAEARNNITEQEKIINTPFAKQAELEKKRARLKELMALLNPKEEQQIASMDEDTVQEQQRTNTLTDREVLSMAAERLEGSPDLTDGERDALRIFKDHLNTLHLLQEERAQQGRLYKEQQFGAKVDKAAATETLNRMHVLDDQIRAANDAVLSVENKEVLRRVLVKARKVVEEQERQHGKEILDRWRERTKNAAAIKKYRERIQSDVNDLYNWITKPDNKDVVKHVPDVLKNAVIPFLTSIDFTSKQQLRGGEATKGDKEFVARLDRLKKALKEDIDMDGMYSGYTDLPVDFMDELQEFIDAVQKILDDGADEFVINRMTGDELKELSKLVRTLKKFITQINRFHVNAMFQHVYEAGDSTINDLSHMASDNGRANGVSNFVFWQQMRPAYAFERFGNGGLSIYDGLRRGQAQLAFNTQKIVKFSREAYTEKEVKEWEDSVVEVNLDSGTVKMKVSHMMSFYELSKQPDSLRHMLMGGIRVATFKDGKKIADRGHKISEDDVKTIIGALTPRQKKVADDLQWFMAKQGGAWGNYVSVARFGEEQFTNELYFPINSDGRHLKSMADENPSAASLYALLNMSFTKSRNEKANNRIILYSIFDVFSNHMASMAQYNAMALPVLDAIKWFNYQQKVDGVNGERIIKDSVREQMARVYGSPEETRPGSGRQGYAEAFILNILKAFNGTEAQGIPSDSLGTNTLRRYNMAQIAYNTRVVIQQPLAITRAALLIDYKSIIRGLAGNTTALKQNIAEMQQHSGIAAWKSLGFYDVNISRGLTDLIKHKSTVMDKIGDVGMWGAEMADLFTWAGIWSACKSEVIKKQRITPDHDGFYEAVTSLFEEIIYKTQVVDSILTKNEYMRSKGFFARATSSFMSEPCATASMALDAYYKYDTDIKNGMTRQQSWKKNGKLIGRTICVYAVSQAMLAAFQAISDAFRDDDEYESYLEKWLDAFGGNLVDELMPLNKLPILSDFYDLAKELLSILGVDTYGNPPQSVFMQWYDSLVKGVKIIYDKIMGEDTNYKWYGGIYKLLQAVSGMTGLPMAAVTREIATIWNNTVGGFVPSLKIKDYEPSELNQIKFAYQDGFLTAEEARAALLENGLADDDDEVYWILQGWDAGDKYSRYDSLNQAMLKGQSIDSAMSELMEHGYTEKEVISHVRGQIGTWYKEGDITREQAEKLLLKYGELNTQEIKSMVDKWSCKIVTGINYDDIKHEYLVGNITEARAIEMRRLYGNETREKAAETVTKWRCEKEVGIAYDDIPDRIINGTLSAEDAKELYVTYGGYTKQDATEKVVSLDFVRQHPECRGISYAAVKSFRQYCEKAGVPAEVFYDVWKQRTELKKDGTMAYIHRLNITRKQKDSLYLAMGWSPSTIAEAPWR